MHTGHMHTFHLNTSSSQGLHPLIFPQLALDTGGTPVFGGPPPLRFTDQLQSSRLPKEDMHHGATVHL